MMPVMRVAIVVLVAGLACSSGQQAAVDAAVPPDGTMLPADASVDVLVEDASSDVACGGVCATKEFCGGATCVSAVVAVSAGTAHTCAVHADGNVSCWGKGAFIRPGLPALTGPVNVPLTERATAVVTGIQAACARLESGAVRCWGDFGAGPQEARAVVKEDGSPLVGVTRIAGGSVVFCAVTGDATYCWGENKDSELARPASMSFPPLTAVMVLPQPQPLIAATVAIIAYDGVSQLCGWGNNDSGIVPGPRDIVAMPTCVSMIPGLLSLTAGDGHVCARRGGATYSCWGENSGGQLGNGDENMNDVPLPGVAASLPAAIDTIAAGAYHTCALLAGGQVMCWGSNDQGECGLPSSAPIFTPTAVTTLVGHVTAIGAGAGAQHTCAVLQDGHVECWGSDLDGQLGSGATTEDANRFSAAPVVVRW
jgi:alpha-tubulin suppressor-like RCC1 family protein